VASVSWHFLGLVTGFALPPHFVESIIKREKLFNLSERKGRGNDFPAAF
jgi:hypothetical protein